MSRYLVEAILTVFIVLFVTFRFTILCSCSVELFLFVVLFLVIDRFKRAGLDIRLRNRNGGIGVMPMVLRGVLLAAGRRTATARLGLRVSVGTGP